MSFDFTANENNLTRRDWMELSAAGVIGSFAAMSIAGADEDPQPAVRPVEAPGGNILWLDCTLERIQEQNNARLLLMIRGDQVERGVCPPLGMAAVNVSGLRFRQGRLTGEVVIGHQPVRQNRSVAPLATRMPLRLDLTIANDQVRGSYSGSWPRSERRLTERAEVRGRVTGDCRDERALRAQNSLPEQANWPSYVGPHQNFSSGPCRRPLVDDLHQARLLWSSQYIGPCESGSHRYGACVGTPPAAGGASPLVWEGRVYQFRYQPAGNVYQRHLDTQLAGPRGQRWRQQMEEVGWTVADMRRRWAIDADEQLVCLDGATGKTLWTLTWPGEGLNLFDHKCSLTNHTGVAADGKIFVFGALGIVRCVDARSGNMCWQTAVPGYSAFMRQLKTRAMNQRHLHAPTRSFCHGLNISGNTVIAPDGISRCGLVGLNAANGRVLWRVPRVLGKAATPLAWEKDGRHYVITGNEEGLIACIEATSGRVMLRYQDAGENSYSMVLSGDYLIGLKLRGEARERVRNIPDPDGIHTASGDNYGQVACWRLSTNGPEQVWQASTQLGAPWNCSVGAVTDGIVCFRGKFSYHLVRVATGQRIASHHLPTAVRWDEGHLLALPGKFILHPDSQHGHTKMFPLSTQPNATVGRMWQPPHPHATTYQAAMSHAWADGRLFIRGLDAIYCYDLRRPA